MINYQNREALVYNHRIYRKRLGRAFRSYWLCVQKGCTGQIILTELKGGSMEVYHKHVPDCLPNA